MAQREKTGAWPAGRVRVSIADPSLAQNMKRVIADVILAAAAAPLPEPRVVRFRTRAKLATLCAETLAGSIAIIRVTERNARYLGAWVGHARQAGALGVQLVWKGAGSMPERVLGHVFRVLEMARATLGEAPVVLSASSRPAFMLRFLIVTNRTHTSMKGSLP